MREPHIDESPPDYKAEVVRLEKELAKANANHERFEREWYLRGDEIELLRTALALMYDKWENGDPCFEDADPTSNFLGNAFPLGDAEERQILALIADRKCVDEGCPHYGTPHGHSLYGDKA